MIAGVVPCAGASTRMGRAKALLEIDGCTFVERVVRALKDGGCDRLVVVVPADPEIEAAARATGAQVLVNSDPGDGPITSLRLAIEHLAPDAHGVIYLPVDHPLVKAQSVRAVVNAAGRRPPLVVPMLGADRGHPAYFDARLFPELLDADLEGGARTVVHRHLDEAVLLALDDFGIRTDIDTPEMYAAVARENLGTAGLS